MTELESLLRAAFRAGQDAAWEEAAQEYRGCGDTYKEPITEDEYIVSVLPD